MKKTKSMVVVECHESNRVFKCEVMEGTCTKDSTIASEYMDPDSTLGQYFNMLDQEFDVDVTFCTVSYICPTSQKIEDSG